jgi:hypothetical protein
MSLAEEVKQVLSAQEDQLLTEVAGKLGIEDYQGRQKVRLALRDLVRQGQAVCHKQGKFFYYRWGGAGVSQGG